VKTEKFDSNQQIRPWKRSSSMIRAHSRYVEKLSWSFDRCRDCLH